MLWVTVTTYYGLVLSSIYIYILYHNGLEVISGSPVLIWYYYFSMPALQWLWLWLLRCENKKTKQKKQWNKIILLFMFGVMSCCVEKIKIWTLIFTTKLSIIWSSNDSAETFLMGVQLQWECAAAGKESRLSESASALLDHWINSSGSGNAYWSSLGNRMIAG